MLKLEFSDNRKPPIWLVDSRYAIGSDASSDIVLEEEGVSGFHAELRVEPGDRIHIADTGSAKGTMVNGRRINERTVLNANDVISIQGVEMQLIDPKEQRNKVPDEASATAVAPALDFGEAGRDAAPREPWKLVARTGSLVGSVFDIPASGRMVIGRSSSCDVVLPSQHVSRQHAEVLFEHGKLKVRDLGSANGTFVNRKQLQESSLQPDDEIRFDTLVFRVQGPEDRDGGTDAQSTAFQPAMEATGDPGNRSSATRTSVTEHSPGSGESARKETREAATPASASGGGEKAPEQTRTSNGQSGSGAGVAVVLVLLAVAIGVAAWWWL